MELGKGSGSRGLSAELAAGLARAAASPSPSAPQPPRPVTRRSNRGPARRAVGPAARDRAERLVAAAGLVLATRAPVATEVPTPPIAVPEPVELIPIVAAPPPAPVAVSPPPVIESAPFVTSVAVEIPDADQHVDPDATRRPLDGDDGNVPVVVWRVVAEAGGDRPLFAGEGVTIGRVSEPDDPARVVVRSDVVSRRHAAVRLRAGVPVVVDLESVNGTWLFRDGAHVEVTTDGTPAADGDVVMTVDGVVLATVRSSGQRG